MWSSACGLRANPPPLLELSLVQRLKTCCSHQLLLELQPQSHARPHPHLGSRQARIPGSHLSWGGHPSVFSMLLGGSPHLSRPQLAAP